MEQLTLDKFLGRRNLVSQRQNGLVLFDYNKTITFEFDWDEITINARGIVFEEATGNIVARPFRKFWNYEELSEGERVNMLPTKYKPNFEGEYMVLEKADGSCGICYFYGGDWNMNTRGSFMSDQAIWGKAYLDSNVRKDLMDISKTYVFEIIYPNNRIVVDYGDREALVLTGVIDNKTGQEMWYDQLQNEAKKIGVDFVKVYTFEKFEDMFSARQGLSVNEEGYVITFKNGYKFKLKGQAYCDVHRKMCALTPLHFWRAFDIETFTMPEEFISELPEEFKESVDKFRDITEGLHNDELNRITAIAATMPEFSDAKERYLHLKETLPVEDVHHVLSVLTGNMKKLKDSIHKKLRPSKNQFTGIQVDDRLQRILHES